jgi:hypothetical protein
MSSQILYNFKELMELFPSQAKDMFKVGWIFAKRPGERAACCRFATRYD